MTHHERLIRAIKATGTRYDLLSDEQVTKLVDETLPDLTITMRGIILDAVDDAFYENVRERALGFLAEWEPRCARTRPN